MRKHARLFAFLAVLAGLTAPACGYFNTMYNAKRSFGEAEEAASRGDRSSALLAYRRSIEKANSMVERRPGSRWADDAQLLAGRAYYALGDMDSARVALTALLVLDPPEDTRSAARIYLGSAEYALGNTQAALELLNAGLSSDAAPAEIRGLGHLERARVWFDLDSANAGWADLERANRFGGEIRARAALQLATRALEQRDTARLRVGFATLLAESNGRRHADTMRTLARRTGSLFSPALTRAYLTELERANWPRAARDSMLLFRAEFAYAAGDHQAAIDDADRVIQRTSGSLADQARLRSARWRLTHLDRLDQLSDVRALLLPALQSSEVRDIIQHIKTTDVLLEMASTTGQPLAIFAAAELVRDELNAPLLARRLFVGYADVATQSVWASKAMLAALDLERTDSIADRIRATVARINGNPYADALEGRADADAFISAEDRLNTGLVSLRARAVLEAVRRDNTVTHAVTVIDSLRVVAQADSTRIACGMMIDSLGVGGIRADSVRAACLRSDRERMGMLLTIDTLMLRDSSKLRADSVRRGAQPMNRDTIRGI